MNESFFASIHPFISPFAIAR